MTDIISTKKTPVGRETMSHRLAALFPDLDRDEAAPAPSPRRPLVRGAVVAVVVIALIAALVGGVFGSSGPGYRTAIASNQNVAAALSGVGTIEPVREATVAFPMAGTVAAVAVKVGDKVIAGQTLATLDTHTLVQTLDQQQATLAQAQLTLSNALAGQSTSTGTTGGATSASLTSAGTAGNPISAVLLAADPALTKAQKQVLDDQKNLDTDEAALGVVLNAAVASCSAPLPNTCITDLGAVQIAQNKVLVDQTTLAHDITNYDTLVNNLPSSTPTTSGGGSTSGSTGSSSRTSSGGASAPTAAQLASDQAAVDTATANVAVAQQALAQATITTPIDGTIDAVNLVIGASVTAASSTATVVVHGSGGYEVSTTIGVDNIPHVGIGAAATIAPDGTHRALSGRVASISLAPNSASSSSTTYLVVIGLTNPNVALGNASTGAVTIVTQQAKATLAVPTSAVTTTGTTHTVGVLHGSTVRQVAVHVGVVGNTWTQITKGLSKGEEVVLADMSQPLPGSATATPGANSTSPVNGITLPNGITINGVGAGGAGAGSRGG